MKKSGLDIKKRPEGGFRLASYRINPFALVYLVLQTMMGILMLVLCLWLKPVDWTVYLLFAGIFVGVPTVICVPLIMISAGEHLMLDEEGVHLCYVFRRRKTLRWAEIMDWGTTELWHSKLPGMTHMLYFSPVPVPCKGKYKQIGAEKGIFAVGFHHTDFRERLFREMLQFCVERLYERVPMYRSAFALLGKDEQEEKS